jgi:hypothetical protein
MRPFQTIAQILIATSVVNCALAAPSPKEKTHERSAIRSDDSAMTMFNKSLLGGIVAGTIATTAYKLQEQIAQAISKAKNKYVRSFPTLSCHANISDLRFHLSTSTSSRSITSPGNDAISRRLANLSDEELRFLSLISRRAIESLD